MPFFSMSAAEFVEMIVGVGAARVRDLFKQAREHAPAIIFIDELDAIGRARGQVAIGGSSEQEQTLNQILTEMDGFSSREGHHRAGGDQPARRARPGAAAARAASIGASSSTCPTRTAARRSSRCTRATCRWRRTSTSRELAAATPGLSGADLQEPGQRGGAARGAPRRRTTVRQKDFLDALEKIVLGPERPLLLSRDDRERIAYHEGGHAILGLVVPGADPVHRVTIVPRGQALGVTYQRPDRRSLQLSRGVPARAHRRHAGRPRGRGDRLRHADHRRRERHRAGDRPRAQHGHALGHERRGSAWCSSRRARIRTSAAGGLRRRPSRSARRPRASSTRRCSGSSTRATSEATAPAARAPQGTRRAGRGAARAGDARRAGDPRRSPACRRRRRWKACRCRMSRVRIPRMFSDCSGPQGGRGRKPL